MGGEELSFVGEAFESNYIAPLGPQVDAFEREFAAQVGARHALAVSSGTAAMHLALRILGVGPGDEVFASTLTFIGSVTPIVFQGATPVFIDSDISSWCMDPDLLEKEVKACKRRGKLPKAVVPTDLYGQCADLNRILEICAPFDIPVIVDAAEALGAQYRRVNGGSAFMHDEKPDYVHAGVGAYATVFSFNGNKIITTSGGGMLVSNDEEFIEKAKFLSQQARDPAPYYEHSEIGYNYRMSNIAAAIGRGQLRVLGERIEQKRRIFRYYRDALGDLAGIGFMPEANYGRSTRWLTAILIDAEEFGVDTETVRLALEAENIESRPTWKPMHLQPVFMNGTEAICEREAKNGNGQACVRHKARVVGGIVSEYLFKTGLCLPSGTQMTEKDLERVVRVIRGLHKIQSQIIPDIPYLSFGHGSAARIAAYSDPA